MFLIKTKAVDEFTRVTKLKLGKKFSEILLFKKII